LNGWIFLYMSANELFVSVVLVTSTRWCGQQVEESNPSQAMTCGRVTRSEPIEQMTGSDRMVLDRRSERLENSMVLPVR
jgi:hypothetical protein